jgi:hypothetical protein
VKKQLLVLTAAAAIFAAPLLAAQAAPGAPAAAPQGTAPGRQGGAAVQGRQGGRGRQAGPALPAPRLASGRVSLGGNTPTDKGLWLPNVGIQVPLAPPDQVPFHDWAKQTYTDRQAHELEPHARCKASGVARQFLTPYGVEFVELPELQRIYIFDVGGPHTYRTVYMDGRTHPKDGVRTYYGHSIGWWEGDTLLIDTTNFNEAFWLDRRGFPHTEQLHTTERFTRTALGTMRYEATIDDPGAYAKPWTGAFDLRWSPDIELFEYVCQQANYAHELMVGTEESVDRSTTIVP